MTTNLTQVKRPLSVAWGDRTWHPEIIVRTSEPVAVLKGGRIFATRAPRVFSAGGFRQRQQARCRLAHRPFARVSSPRRGFTLVELLVVIAVIAILAAMLMPAFQKARRNVEVTQAKKDVTEIATACSAYESTYSRLPISARAATNAADFTYGATIGGVPIVAAGNYQTDNREVVAILMDLEKYGNGLSTINSGHVKNPQRNKYLNPKMVTDGSHGVSSDGVFRDPWDNPYIISLDANNDDKVRDAFYGLQAVSQESGSRGFNGLFNAVGSGDNFEYNGQVMVWSAGPDKRINPAAKANDDVNKDNVLSWK
jgi:prepilin-type N-terminal cleavage/methylation domain-containing protein